MDKINNVSFGPLTLSKFVQPFRMFYTQDGVEKTWDLVEVQPGVCIVLYNTTRKTLVFVKQFRPAVYYSRIPIEDRHSGKIIAGKYPGKLGITLELCAGCVDKSKTLQEIVQEEVLEECGYKVPLINIEKAICYKTGVSTDGDQQTMFYAEVDDDMKVSRGGGVEDELIEVVEMSIPEVLEYINQDEVQSPAWFLYGVLWFLQNKYKSC